MAWTGCEKEVPPEIRYDPARAQTACRSPGTDRLFHVWTLRCSRIQTFQEQRNRGTRVRIAKCWHAESKAIGFSLVDSRSNVLSQSKKNCRGGRGEILSRKTPLLCDFSCAFWRIGIVLSISDEGL